MIDWLLNAKPRNVNPLWDRDPGYGGREACFGKVIAVGKGKILENGHVRALDIKVGDKILFGKYGGTEVKVDGVKLW